MAKKSNVATVLIGNSKYEIESDTIVNIDLKNGGMYKNLRVTGVSRMGDCLRCVSKDDGIIEVPFKSIDKIVDVDADKKEFAGVKVTARR